MPEVETHTEYVQRTLRKCQATSITTCKCGEKHKRVCWRGTGDSNVCYPEREEPAAGETLPWGSGPT